jgi:hypothetical protein
MICLANLEFKVPWSEDVRLDLGIIVSVSECFFLAEGALL